MKEFFQKNTNTDFFKENRLLSKFEKGAEQIGKPKIPESIPTDDTSEFNRQFTKETEAIEQAMKRLNSLQKAGGRPTKQKKEKIPPKPPEAVREKIDFDSFALDAIKESLGKMYEGKVLREELKAAKNILDNNISKDQKAEINIHINRFDPDNPNILDSFSTQLAILVNKFRIIDSARKVDAEGLQTAKTNEKEANKKLDNVFKRMDELSTYENKIKAEEQNREKVKNIVNKKYNELLGDLAKLNKGLAVLREGAKEFNNKALQIRKNRLNILRSRKGKAKVPAEEIKKFVADLNKAKESNADAYYKEVALNSKINEKKREIRRYKIGVDSLSRGEKVTFAGRQILSEIRIKAEKDTIELDWEDLQSMEKEQKSSLKIASANVSNITANIKENNSKEIEAKKSLKTLLGLLPKLAEVRLPPTNELALNLIHSRNDKLSVEAGLPVLGKENEYFLKNLVDLDRNPTTKALMRLATQEQSNDLLNKLNKYRITAKILLRKELGEVLELQKKGKEKQAQLAFRKLFEKGDDYYYIMGKPWRNAEEAQEELAIAKENFKEGKWTRKEMQIAERKVEAAKYEVNRQMLAFVEKKEEKASEAYAGGPSPEDIE